MTTNSQIGQKVWSYCNVLRDAGLSYGDYLEQITYLLFLKMMDERSKPPYTLMPGYVPPPIPKQYNWQSLVELDGPDLEMHYRSTLAALGREPGALGLIFRRAQNKIHDPAMLRRLVADLVGTENWSAMGSDVKGSVYEDLLERYAQDVKAGAGQYFTPRPLIAAVVDVMRPEPSTTVCDPAAGTGGFLLRAHDYVVDHNPNLPKNELDALKNNALSGWEIVQQTARLCVMNLYLHGIGGDEPVIRVDDSLRSRHGEYGMVLTNPPFGRKSSLAYGLDDDAGEDDLLVERDDFWATTKNKQLNFVQHVRSILKINGRAAVVVPDNVLFDGGPGETIRRNLMRECDVHTLLRLPTGIFYAQGVKANVLFFDRKPASETPWTKTLWIYDLRTNKHFTLKTKQMGRADLDDFVASYNPANRYERHETERFRAFSYGDLLKRDKVNLDITWLRDESVEDTASLPEPEALVEEIVEGLQTALNQFAAISVDLGERSHP